MNLPDNFNFLVRAEAPSNIAFIKYWGKSDSLVNWPANDSLSMTLQNCRSITDVGIVSGDSPIIFFDGKKLDPGDKRAEKIQLFLIEHKKRSLKIYRDAQKKTNEAPQQPPNILDFSEAYQKRTGNEPGPNPQYFNSSLLISTKNTFPTASGIASSASGFAALTIASLAVWTGSQSFDDLARCGFDIPILARLARFGSGSACRSFMGGFIHWSKGETSEKQTINPVSAATDLTLSDLVVIFSSRAKDVSSRDAHLAAASSPLFGPRIAHIPERLALLKSALSARNMPQLGAIIETEALEIHAISMTGSPPVNYLSPETLSFLSWLRYFRQEHKIEGFFTIDAGPNVHVICEKHWEKTWIQAINKSFPEAQIILDGMGRGPTLKSLVAPLREEI